MNLYNLILTAPENVKKSFIYRKHSNGSSIILPAEKNNYLYILIHGSADVIMQSYSGTAITLNTYEAYSCFGEVELFNESAITFNIQSRTLCKTISVPKNNVFEWMQLDFNFTKYLIKQLADKLLKNTNSVANLSLLSVKDRLLNNIYYHYSIGDLSNVTKQVLSSETCIPLRSLNRSIAECKSDGFIDFKDKCFRILSVEKLTFYCNSLL